MDDRTFWEQRIGTTIRDTWRLESLLGVGGMAAVYVGAQRIGRRDAVKILHPEVARSPDLRARFEQEARLLCSFRHPGAVEVFTMGTTEDGLPFLVMELLEGESLAARAKRLDGLQAGEMLRIIDEVLDVLGAAHAQGIIHRDIKLDNVFVLNSGRAKVLDFGIARLRNAEHAVKTRIGSMLGTLPYMPPEQIRGSDVDGRADLFATGAMMFRLLTKRRIHEAGSEAEMLIKMSTEPAPPVGTIAKDVPTPVCMVVDRALAFRKERRYPDAATMQADVRAVLQGQTPPYATARLAAGDAPNMTTAPAPPASSASEAFRDEPTAAPRPAAEAFRDEPTAAPAQPAGAAPVTTSQHGLEATPSKPVQAASIMFAPTMMATSASLGLAPSPTPSPTPSPSPNPAMPSQAMPSQATPSPAMPSPAAPAPAPMAPAQSYGAITPPPVAASVTSATSEKPKPKVPLIAAIIGGVVCLLLLFIGIAVLRGQDEPGSPSDATSAQTAGEGRSGTPGAESTSGTNTKSKPKGKRNWDKVRW